MKKEKTTPKKIDKLSPAQIDKFPYYVEKWVKIGLNTDQCNFEKAKEAAQVSYNCTGLVPPNFYFLFDCPVTAGIGRVVIEKVFDKINKTINTKMVGVENSVIEKQPPKKNTTKKQVTTDKVVIKVIKSVIDQFVNNNKLTKEQLNNIKNIDVKALREEIRGTDLNSALTEQIFGNQETWLAFYDFFITECNVDLPEIVGLLKMSEVCGWWAPYDMCCIFQNRPLEIHRDEQGRLHNNNGPAVIYRGDVTKVYAVHGVNVPENVITRKFTWRDIDKETNVEIKRVMINIYGPDKYILDSGTKPLHKDEFGTLYVREQNGDEKIMMVKVTNSTPEQDGTFKEYWLRVDPDAYGGIKTARAAVASTWTKADRTMVFENPEDYNLLMET